MIIEESEEENVLMPETSGSVGAAAVPQEIVMSIDPPVEHPLSEIVKNLPEKPRKYVGDMIMKKYPEVDITFGAYFDKTILKLGRSKLNFTPDGHINLDGEIYQGTPGLYELIFKHAPDANVIVGSGMEEYKKLLSQTNVHKLHFKDEGKVKGNRGKKYTDVIKPLLGKGLQNRMRKSKIKVETKDEDSISRNPNMLVNRLRLLIKSKKTGHTGHKSEIRSIVRKLIGMGVIKAT